MKRMRMKMRLGITCLIALGLGILLIAPTQAVVDSESVADKELEERLSEYPVIRQSGDNPGVTGESPKEPKIPKYAPGEVLVGLKEGIAIEDVLKDVTIKPKSFGRVHDIKPAVNKFKKTLKLEKDSKGWLRFLGKNYKEVEDIPDGELFKETYKSMPEVEKRLYRSYKIKLPETISVEEAVAKLKENPDVEYAQPNYLNELYMVPNDPYYYSQGSWGQPYDDLWGIKKIQCEAAWDISQGEGVVVAVIDTGIDYNHLDLKDNMWKDANGKYGYDFSDNDDDPADYYGHGTHVAGTIAGVGNNGIGVIGVAPKAKIIAVKIFPNAYDDVCAQAIRYAADNGAKVLSNSWGPGDRRPSNPEVEGAIDYAYERGCVIVFAAGNSDDDVAYYSPANYPKVITVAASTQRDEKCSFSNYGYKIDVAAPGGGYENELGGGWDDIYNILSTMPDSSEIAQSKPNLKVSNGYWRLAGTSMATPHVAAVAILILGRHPELTNEQVRWAMRFSADDVDIPGVDPNSGYGRINAAKAVTIDPVSVLDVEITTPSNGADIGALESVEISGTAAGSNFVSYELSYGSGLTPTKWVTIVGPATTPVENGLLGTWNIGLLETNYYMLRLAATDTLGFIYDTYVLVFKEEGVRPLLVEAAVRQAPAISGDKVVFRGFCNGRYGICLYDMATNEEVWLGDPVVNTEPHISGDKVVWHGFCGGSVWPASKICLYDLSNNTLQAIASYPVANTEPHISGDKVVWHGFCGGSDSKICLYDISNNTLQAIPSYPAVGSYPHPAISGDYVVWYDIRPGGNGSIYCYNLTTSTEQRIPSYPSPLEDLAHPDISGNKIVWVDVGNVKCGNCFDIYLYDLTTNTAQLILDDLIYSLPPEPTVSGDKVVFSKGSDIYTYDLNTKTERPITINSALQIKPDIYGNTVVWQDGRNGNWDIYMYEIPRTPPCGSFGDVDLDGFVTANDAQMVLQYVAGSITLTEEQKIRADVDADGDVDSVDAMFIQQYIEGIIDTFPVCTKDTDNDGFTDWVELYIGTDPNKACGPNAWPPDFNDDGIVQIDDVSAVVSRFGLKEGDAGYSPRYELASQNGVIQIDDVGLIASYFGKRCFVDTDNDGIPDYLDPDDDNDGFTDEAELFIGTDPKRACGPNAWPPDFNDDGIVQIDDVSAVVSRFGAREGDAKYSRRYELASQDGLIQIDDVTLIAGYFGKRCH